MKSRFRKWFIFLFLVFAGCLMMKTEAQAAVAQITIQKSQQDIVKGDVFYVIVTVTSDEEINGFEGYFSYNQNVMQFITGGSIASGNDDEIHIKDLNRDTGTQKIKYSLQFRARRAGTSSVALKRYRQIKKAEEDTRLSVGSASLEIEVISQKEYEAKIKKQEKQQAPVQAEEEQVEESTELPEVSMPAMNPSDQPSETDSGDDVVTDAATLPAATSGEAENPEESGGLTKGICIVILCLAVAGFIIVAALLANTLKEAGADKEAEEADPIESPERPDQAVEDENRDEMSPADQEKRLNEIEKRLEEKRRWLRKE
ncbi:cohesin domain-containing protein [Jutongia sp.]|uniref:cohesin domain-containing protein n=1 Tax=Jutongia sp. TaxID=2944204 RepID=UPI0030799CAF